MKRLKRMLVCLVLTLVWSGIGFGQDLEPITDLLSTANPSYLTLEGNFGFTSLSSDSSYVDAQYSSQFNTTLGVKFRLAIAGGVATTMGMFYSTRGAEIDDGEGSLSYSSIYFPLTMDIQFKLGGNVDMTLFGGIYVALITSAEVTEDGYTEELDIWTEGDSPNDYDFENFDMGLTFGSYLNFWMSTSTNFYLGVRVDLGMTELLNIYKVSESRNIRTFALMLSTGFNFNI